MSNEINTPTEPIAAAPAETESRPFNTRGFTSLLLTIVFLIMSVSGIMLYFTPRGRTANWTDWSLLGLGKHEWGAVHINLAILFLAVSVFHLLLNWKMFWGYIKKKSGQLHMGKEMALASIVGLVFLAGSIISIPPFSSIMAVNEDIKNYWDNNAPAAPAPHADEFTLAKFSQQIALPLEDITKALQDEGYTIENSEITIAQIGEQKGLPASQVMAAIRKHYPEAGMGMGPGGGMGMGQGMGMGHGMGMGPGTTGACSSEAAGGEACEETATCPGDGSGATGEHQPGMGPGAEGHGPGYGRGMGMGMGRGMGMGQGMGQGPGAQGGNHE